MNPPVSFTMAGMLAIKELSNFEKFRQSYVSYCHTLFDLHFKARKGTSRYINPRKDFSQAASFDMRGTQREGNQVVSCSSILLFYCSMAILTSMISRRDRGAGPE